MTKKVFFIVISLVILIVVYVTSLTGIIVERQSVTLNRILDEARDSGDFTTYTKYSSEMYKPLYLNVISDDSDYQFTVYQTIESSKNGLLSGFILFVLPVNDVLHSDVRYTESDLSNIIVTNGTKTYDATNDPAYEKFSISYGLKDRGFYYYAFKPDFYGNFDITVTDYSGHSILSAKTAYTELTLDVDVKDKVAKEAFFQTLSQEGFLRSFTIDEINDLYEFDAHIWKAYVYAGIFVVIDISFGYFFIFKRKH